MILIYSLRILQSNDGEKEKTSGQTCKHVITNYEGNHFKEKNSSIIENSKGGAYLKRIL